MYVIMMIKEVFSSFEKTHDTYVGNVFVLVCVGRGQES